MSVYRQTTVQELDDAVANSPQKIIKIQDNIDKLDEKMEEVGGGIYNVHGF